MITGFEEWAASAQLIETGSFDQLKDRILGIEAEDYIDRILTSAPTKEPLLPALGGLPFSLETIIEGHLSALEKASIKPLFVFSGLQFNGGRERKLQSSVQYAKNVGAAWDLYNASNPERAVSEFGNSCTFEVDHIYRHVQSFFHKNKVDFLVAPYSACAQLAYLEGTAHCDAVAGSTEMLMFEIERVVINLDFDRLTFSWVTRRSCIEALAVGSTSLFVDACLLAGSSFLPTLPQLDIEPSPPPKAPKIRAAADLIKRLGSFNGNAICLQYQDDPIMQSLNYVDLYHRAYLTIRNHVVIMIDGKVEPLNIDIAPSDVHEFIGQRLPDELYFYHTRGIIGPRILNWRTTGEVLETPPLDGGLSVTYQKLVREQLLPLRQTCLALLSYSLHRFYSHREVNLRCWFNEQGKTISIADVADPKTPLADWNVHIDKPSADQAMSTLGYATQSLKDATFAQSTVTPRKSDAKPLKTKDEVCANTLWRFLQLRGYVSKDHTLSPLGESLATATVQCQQSSEMEEAVFLAMELIRLNLLRSDNMFPAPPYHGAPYRGNDTDQRNTLLVSRVACLGQVRHKKIGFTGPLSRHLLAYSSIVSAVRRTQRDLIEMTLCTMLLNGSVSRDMDERVLQDSAFSLPFLHDVDCALGIAVKSYLEELAGHSGPITSAAKQAVVEKGAKQWMPHTEGFGDNLAHAFKIWDAVYAAVKSAPTDVVSDADKKAWADVDEWTQARR